MWRRKILRQLETKFGKREQQEFCPAKLTFWHQPQKNFIEVQQEISKFKGCWRVIIFFFLQSQKFTLLGNVIYATR